MFAEAARVMIGYVCDLCGWHAWLQALIVVASVWVRVLYGGIW